MSRIDIRQEVTNRVIAALEKGGLAEWTKPWASLGGKAGMGGAMPWNFSTGRKYQGINTMLLLMHCMDEGFATNAWLTFNQAKALGATVRKGEKGTPIVTYRLREVPSQRDSAEDGEMVTIPFSRQFYVFNVEQVDGLDLRALEPRPVLDETGKLAEIEAITQRLCEETGLTFQRAGDRALYHLLMDRLVMPAGAWNTGGDFIATLAHELVHATGAGHRLNRHAMLQERFKEAADQRYAFEELVAELGAAMLCAELGVVGDHLQHESYIASWLQALRGDKSFIFRAATLASDAHRYLMGEAAEAEAQEGASVDAAA